MNLKVASLNTESGCRPGFHEYLKQFITYTEPDVIALQEVHSAANLSVPETFMPSNRGKRIYPQRLRLYQELCHRYGETFELLFTPNLHGLHDCEQGKYDVAFGQVTMVRRQTWKVVNSASGLVFLDEYTFNTEHGVVIGGMPSSKAAITVVIKCTMSGKTVTMC